LDSTARQENESDVISEKIQRVRTPSSNAVAFAGPVDGVWPSDHFSVVADLRVPAAADAMA
jgi:hypothetical protein